MEKTIYILVGPHRSGTSVFTQILSTAGLDIGRSLMLPAADNPRGFWENQKIVNIHDGLLESFDKNWSTAAQLPAGWLASEAAQKAKDAIYQILSTDFPMSAPSLVKDPRLVYLQPLWEQMAAERGMDIKTIGIVRCPIDVAKSIFKRNGGTFESALYISMSYVAGLATLTESSQFPILKYEHMVECDGQTLLEKLEAIFAPTQLNTNASIVSTIDQLIFNPKASIEKTNELAQLYEKITTSDILLLSQGALTDFVEGELFQDQFQALDLKFQNQQSIYLDTNEFVTLEKNKVYGLQEMLSQYEAESSVNIGLLKEKTASAAALEEELSSVKSDVSKEKKLSEKLKENINDLSRLISDLEVDLTQKEAEFKSLSIVVEDYQKTITTLGGEVEEKNETIGRFDEIKKAYAEALIAEEIKREEDSKEFKRIIETEKAHGAHMEKQKERLAVELQAEELKHSETSKDLKKLLATEKRRVTRAKKEKIKLETALKEQNYKLEAALKAENLKLVKEAENSKRLTDVVNKGLEELSEKNKHIGEMNNSLYSLNEKIGILEHDYNELLALKQMQDIKIDVDTSRSKSVEQNLNSQLDDLNRKISYYEASPLKVALKHLIFGALRIARRLLPLPAAQKAKLAEKFNPLATRLKPQTLIANPDIELKPEKINTDFSFQEHANPVISIIVPVYNEIAQTVACLHSIYEQNVGVPYEVILADDRSPDPFHVIFSEIDGLRYYRNPENLGFLGNCNLNSGYARGEYIVFLNNDTLVKPGWLQTLYDTFNEHADVGIAGSKLVFPSGELQEAGGIIWEDASGWNWGRGENPDHPRYNYVRDVDYVSGASFMIRTDLFRDIGGFYTGLEKAYYEDTDCCFRVRELGYRVIYQPLSKVVHIEGLSSGTDVTAGAKKYQLVNKEIFFETWKHRLETHLPNAQTPEIASDRKVKGHVLYIDAVTPEPDKDSGSIDAVNAMQIIRNLGYRVHFVPGTNFAHWGKATHDLQRKGIECIYHPFYSNIDMLLDERGDAFDYIVLARAEVSGLFLDKVKKACPSAKIIFNSVDMHYVRMEREAKVTGDANIYEAAAIMKR